jgi:phytoene synthase
MQHSARADQADLLACTESIKKGSLSFAMASFLLSLKHRSAIHALYSWCRHCDNTIDDIPKSASTASKLAAIDSLRRDTDLALAGTYDGPGFVFRSIQLMNRTHQIPRRYFHDLIDGMAMDIDKHRYANLSDLNLYCYRVAGVVGLMFSHIVGVRSESALDQAVALGTAMQLTNIARDVTEDFRMGRIYLPEKWLRQAGVEPDRLTGNAVQLWPVITRLLQEADRYYNTGDQGIIQLPWKAALAAKAARNIYSEIGRRILVRGPQYLTSRTVVSGPRKVALIIKTLAQLTLQIPWRVLHPFQRCSFRKEWRYQ